MYLGCHEFYLKGKLEIVSHDPEKCPLCIERKKEDINGTISEAKETLFNSWNKSVSFLKQKVTQWKEEAGKVFFKLIYLIMCLSIFIYFIFIISLFHYFYD